MHVGADGVCHRKPACACTPLTPPYPGSDAPYGPEVAFTHLSKSKGLPSLECAMSRLCVGMQTRPEFVDREIMRGNNVPLGEMIVEWLRRDELP